MARFLKEMRTNLGLLKAAVHEQSNTYLTFTPTERGYAWFPMNAAGAKLPPLESCVLLLVCGADSLGYFVLREMNMGVSYRTRIQLDETAKLRAQRIEAIEVHKADDDDGEEPTAQRQRPEVDPESLRVAIAVCSISGDTVKLRSCYFTSDSMGTALLATALVGATPNS